MIPPWESFSPSRALLDCCLLGVPSCWGRGGEHPPRDEQGPLLPIQRWLFLLCNRPQAVPGAYSDCTSAKVEVVNLGLKVEVGRGRVYIGARVSHRHWWLRSLSAEGSLLGGSFALNLPWPQINRAGPLKELFFFLL